MNTVLIAVALSTVGITTERGTHQHTADKGAVHAANHTVRKPVVVSSPVITTPELELHSVEHNIVAKTNAARIRHGRAPLALDPSLMRSARGHATWMARNRRMQHTGAAVAENIAMGQSSSSEAVRDWMNSPGHRANILSSQYTRIGVAAYRGPDGQVYWCQQFVR